MAVPALVTLATDPACFGDTYGAAGYRRSSGTASSQILRERVTITKAFLFIARRSNQKEYSWEGSVVPRGLYRLEW